VDTFIAALGAGDEGGVVSVQSMSINSTRSRDDVPLALRRFTARTKMKGVSIWEETGESIARHIWYDLFLADHWHWRALSLESMKAVTSTHLCW